MEQLLALEMVRVTEAAALASARFMGRGEKDEADQAATEAMRRTMDEIEFAGTIVIGEGERDEAPMLYIGEQVGRSRRRRRPGQIDIAVDPLEGTNLVAHGRRTRSRSLPRPRTRRPDPRAGHLPREALRRAGRGRQGRHPRSPDREPPAHRPGARPPHQRHHRRHPRPPAARDLIAEVREAGARIKLITDGDLSAAISCAVSGTGVHAVMGIGGAPEGVLTAAALRCLGGEIQARFRYRNDRSEKARGARMGHGDEDRVYLTEDLASGDNLVFAATGVTGGDLLQGVRYFGGGARTHSLVDGLPDQAGPLHRHGPHVRPGPAAVGPALSSAVAGDRVIVAMGGGGFSMPPDNGRLDAFLLALAKERSGRERPRICFVPTAAGDDNWAVARFYGAFARSADASHLALFFRTVEDVDAFLLDQDLVFIGGGNTVNMLAIWRQHGVDGALLAAREAGVVMSGMSAGAICWFEGFTTDSFGPELRPVRDGLGVLPGSFVPHYHGEAQRRPLFHRLVADGTLPGGFAVDDGAALVFRGTELVEGVSAMAGASAFRVEAADGVAVETELSIRRLDG